MFTTDDDAEQDPVKYTRAHTSNSFVLALMDEVDRGRQRRLDRELRPDHEPGVDCPNSPATCLICQPKRRPHA